jgi:hypothetical protein
VAYLRKNHNASLPSGHIHVAFLSDDYYQKRDEMLDDIKYILEKFLESL